VRSKQEFNDRFFPHEQRELKATEFLELTQGDMNAEQYSNKFTELLRYAPNSVPNKETKVERFLCGLQSKIRGRVICHGVNEYTKLVHQASIAERSVNDESAYEARKKRSTPTPTYPAKRQAIAISSGAAFKRNCPQPNSSSRPICTTCGKSHFGEC
jgi:hypothetical protein